MTQGSFFYCTTMSKLIHAMMVASDEMEFTEVIEFSDHIYLMCTMDACLTCKIVDCSRPNRISSISSQNTNSA